jgi:hypothetical protein
MNTISKTAPVSALRFGNPFLRAGSAFGHPSPFETDPADVAVDAPEGSYTYALVQSAPPVPAEECETPALAAEVMVRWGTSVLRVAHLSPPRSFYVGESNDKLFPCDCALPAEALGAARMPVILAGPDGAVRLVIAPGATGKVLFAGEAARSVGEILASGRAQPSMEVAGGHEVALPPGARAEIELGGISFEVSTGNAGRAVAGRLAVDSRSLPYQGLSLLLHLGLLGATAIFMPPLAMASEDGISDEQKYELQQAFKTLAEPERDQREDTTADTQYPDNEGGTGARGKNEEGKAGSQVSLNRSGRFGIEGPKDNPDVHLSHDQAIRDALDFGMIGLLHNGGGGDPNTMAVLWGRADALGADPKSALGNMWGPTIDDAAGAGGIGLTGVGEGGGGLFEGVGLGRVGTIGHGSGLGDGQGFGPGHGGSLGLSPLAYKPKGAPIVRIGGGDVSGRIPPEVIQRIVRQNNGRFRLCYENGLRGNPSLQGRVVVRFVISDGGAVMSAANGGSDLPDAGVVSCVTRAFYGLSFPAPDRGIVTVSYPIMFSPAG